MKLLIAILAGFALVFGGVALAITRNRIRDDWVRQGPGPIARNIRSSNRLVIGVTFALLVGAALLEAFIPSFHSLLLNLQYDLGEMLLIASPVGIWQNGIGGGISWALYLSILLGVFLGVVVGSWGGCKSYGNTRAITPAQLT